MCMRHNVANLLKTSVYFATVIYLYQSIGKAKALCRGVF